MLKTVIDRLEAEIEAAEEYIDHAFDKRSHCPETANLFISIAGEELQHAEKLIRQGQTLCDRLKSQHVMAAEAGTLTAEGHYGKHDPHMHTIWHWEKDKALEDIAELKLKMQAYKTSM